MKVIFVTLLALCSILGLTLAYGYGSAGANYGSYGNKGSFLSSFGFNNKDSGFGGIFELIIFVAIILPLIRNLTGTTSGTGNIIVVNSTS